MLILYYEKDILSRSSAILFIITLIALVLRCKCFIRAFFSLFVSNTELYLSHIFNCSSALLSAMKALARWSLIVSSGKGRFSLRIGTICGNHCDNVDLWCPTYQFTLFQLAWSRCLRNWRGLHGIANLWLNEAKPGVTIQRSSRTFRNTSSPCWLDMGWFDAPYCWRRTRHSK